jgi:hypothetical protein
MIPEISRSSVVFPEPFRPTSPTAPPGSMRNETSRSATTSVGRDRPRATIASFRRRDSRG